MKGHTKIILTDVNTGEQEVHEDDNLITNALDKLININVAIGHSLNTYILPFATKGLGGIMLFDDTLTEDPDNYHFPTEAHLVGYADRSVNASDRFRGSFNSTESGKTMTGYVSVWDFGTSQANGTIKAVALTNVHAGAAPLYNYNAQDYWRTYNGAPQTDFSWCPFRYDGTYLYMLKGNSSTHVMRMARVKIPMLGMGCADYSDVGRSYEVIASWSTLVTEYTYYNSQSDMDNRRNPRTQYVYADDPQQYEDGRDGKLYCVFYGACRSYNTYNYDISYFTVDLEGETIERSETVRLSSGTSYYKNSYYNEMYTANRYWGHVHKGILYRIAGGRKVIYKIPLANVASYTAIRVVADSNPDYVEDLNMVCPHEGGVYFELYHYTTTSWNRLNGIAYPDGTVVLPETSYAGQNNDHGGGRYTGYGRTCDDDLTVWGWYDEDEVTRLWTVNYLGTINNLASAITKTPAQTMKIVYTLTDIDGESEG